MQFPVAVVATVDVVVALPAPASGGVVQFEARQEAVGLCEVSAACEDLVHEVFHAHYAVFTKVFLDLQIAEKKNN